MAKAGREVSLVNEAAAWFSGGREPRAQARGSYWADEKPGRWANWDHWVVGVLLRAGAWKCPGNTAHTRCELGRRSGIGIAEF